VQFEPLGSEEPSGALTEFAAELIDRDEERPASGREGLPKRFRMRHGRHYVDELLGDGPLRTVREIPISEIEPPPPEGFSASVDGNGGAGLDALEQSIRRVGVIEPLAVARRGAQYRVITGMRRLRAARTVGLSTVPCLVHDVDDVRFADLREAAISPMTSAPAVAPAAPEVSEPEVPPASTNGHLRDLVLAEIAEVESLRSHTASAAADLLVRAAIVLERSPVSCAELIDEAFSAIAAEARLRDLRVHLIRQPAGGPFTLDAARCRIALLGLFQALIGMPDRKGGLLDVHAQVTTVRPALIIDCQLRDAGVAIGDEAAERFFDAAWSDHPAGPDGAVMLAAVARIARAHGGRVQARSGGMVTFVLPRPLSDL